MKITLDVENTVTKRDGKLHLDPFEPSNSLVQVGILTDNGEENIITFDHSECSCTNNGHSIVQEWLDKATVLIMHNAAYDLVWLWESGFKYDGPVFDTMLVAYLLQRGQKEPLSLEACAERYSLDTKKQDTLKDYFSKGYSTRDIPHAELSDYLSADLHATQQLSDKLWHDINLNGASLIPTMVLTNQVCVTLARIYQRGFKVDRTALDKVRVEFETERDTLQRELQVHVRKLMGDTPINLNSPEQLGWVIYGRKLIDKEKWGNDIDPYMPDVDFRRMIKTNTHRLYKTKAHQCAECKGAGKVRKTRKDGTLFSKPNTCKICNGNGYSLTDTTVRAGLKFRPSNAKWSSANGFSTSKQNLETLENKARDKGLIDAEDFLSKVRRLSAVETYLSSFVDGITTHTKSDDMLHVRLLQHRTSTGRFSGADPNMQNMPRGGTFPVKRVFVSRWTGGQIMEADFAQLEFRVAAFLAQDKVAMEEVATGFDVHAYTAKVITEAGQPTSRQAGKEHTFAPLYGASSFGRTEAEGAYYKQFNKKYAGIAKWHNELAKEAINMGTITTPSGRQFAFPDVKRSVNGRVSHFTQIKNYPVQSFATACIVPVALLYIEDLLSPMKSCIVNTVHDSIVIDVHPHEERQVIEHIHKTNKALPNLIKQRWGVCFNVPLLLEAKIGFNWLDTKDVN